MLTRRFRVQDWLSLFLAVTGFLMGMAPAAATEDRQLLEVQIKRFWAAEVEQDYGAVYDMLSIDEQNTMKREDYVTLRKEVGPARYVTAEVGEIEFAGDLAWVHVKVDWMLPRYAYAGSRPVAMWHLWRNIGGWHPIPLDERDKWPILPPRLRPAAEEAVLKQRVTGLWQAKAAQDWSSVYTYLPPWFRERTSLEKFLGSKARFLYLSPEVQWVEVNGNDARALIAVGYKLNDPATTKMPSHMDKPIESWIKVDGVWYVYAAPADEPEAPAKENAK